MERQELKAEQWGETEKEICIDIHSIYHTPNSHVDQTGSLQRNRELHANTHTQVYISIMVGTFHFRIPVVKTVKHEVRNVKVTGLIKYKGRYIVTQPYMGHSTELYIINIISLTIF